MNHLPPLEEVGEFVRQIAKRHDEMCVRYNNSPMAHSLEDSMSPLSMETRAFAISCVLAWIREQRAQTPPLS